MAKVSLVGCSKHTPLRAVDKEEIVQQKCLLLPKPARHIDFYIPNNHNVLSGLLGLASYEAAVFELSLRQGRKVYF